MCMCVVCVLVELQIVIAIDLDSQRCGTCVEFQILNFVICLLDSIRIKVCVCVRVCVRVCECVCTYVSACVFMGGTRICKFVHTV